MTEFRVGIDVGGTFTDGMAVSDTGEVRVAKVPSRPSDTAGAILQCIDDLQLDWEHVGLFVHGTTIGTNAIVEQRGARIAHVTTTGYRDILYIRRGDSKPYDLTWRPPTPIVRRRDIYEVPERLLWDGSVDQPLDEAEARRVAQIIAEKEYPAVSVTFLHSYANAEHELAMKEILNELCPDADVCISSEVLPQYREFERSSTTAANAYLMPLLRHYLSELRQGVAERGSSRDVLVMQSSGGVTTSADAQERPARTVRSGPAGGAIAAAAVADHRQADSAVFIDMGGTSTEVAVLDEGKVRWTPELEFAWGVPIRFPAIDIHSIGAGGGSIAWVEGDQFLKVGPHSAGASPGPACYDQGGVQPTTTDAQVVLGRLSPVALLDGAMPIDSSLAEQAITSSIGEPLGMDLIASARGIIEVNTQNTVQAIRLMTVNRGLDPREAHLIALGGSGPLYAAEIATQLGMKSAVVPAYSGLASASGMLIADFTYDASATILLREQDVDVSAVSAVFDRLAEEVTDRLDAAHVADAAREVEYMLDLRYEGQGFELTVQVSPEDGDANADGWAFDAESLERAKVKFHELHQREFGWHHTDWTIEVVLARVNARGPMGVDSSSNSEVTADSIFSRVGSQGVADRQEKAGERQCYFTGYDEPHLTPVVRRESLAPEDELAGPVIIEQVDTTTVVPPNWRATVDRWRNLVLEAD